MGLFNRQKTQTISDLENYYANRNNSTGRAWLMALLSLLVTILVLAALFFGVRWIYRTLTNDETTVVTTTQNDTNNDANVSVIEPTQPATDQTTTPSGNTTTTPQSEPNGVVSDQAASTTTPSSSSTRTQGVASTPRTGDELPKTGAELNSLIAMLLLVTTAGYLIARSRFAKQ